MPNGKNSKGASTAPFSFGDTSTKHSDSNNNAKRTATVIGAGIAGACIANALHNSNFNVTVVEQNSAPALEASGNPVGLVMLRLDRGDHPAALLRRKAFDYAVTFYESLGDKGFISRGIYDRVFDHERQQQLLDAQLFPATDLYQQNGALFHRLAGCISPPNTIQHLLQGCTVVASKKADDVSHLKSDVVVLASGRALGQHANLSLQYKAGQLDWCPQATTSPTIMESGYAATHNQHLYFGATFDDWATPSIMPTTSTENTNKNIKKLAALLPGLQVNQTSARAALRVSTYDRLPVAGHLHDNIYCLGALGSRGLTMAPLLANALAAEICGTESPLSTSLWRLVRPERLKNSA